MVTVLCAIACAVLAELVFLIGYLLGYFLFATLSFGFVSIFLSTVKLIATLTKGMHDNPIVEAHSKTRRFLQASLSRAFHGLLRLGEISNIRYIGRPLFVIAFTVPFIVMPLLILLGLSLNVVVTVLSFFALLLSLAILSCFALLTVVPWRLLSRRTFLHASLAGIAGGFGGTFSAYAVALLVARKVGIPGSLALFVGLALPAIGELQCLEFTSRVLSGQLRPAGFPGRLHLAVKTFPQAAEYEGARLYLAGSQQADIENVDIKHKAAVHANWYVSAMCVGSIVGALVGLTLALWWLSPNLAR